MFLNHTSALSRQRNIRFCHFTYQLQGCCGLRQVLVPAIFRDDLDLLRVKAKGASDIIRSTFAFQGLMKYAGWVFRCAFRTREFSDVWTSYRMTTRNALSDENLRDRKLRLPLAPHEAGGITQRNSTSRPFQENCLLKAIVRRECLWHLRKHRRNSIRHDITTNDLVLKSQGGILMRKLL